MTVCVLLSTFPNGEGRRRKFRQEVTCTSTPPTGETGPEFVLYENRQIVKLVTYLEITEKSNFFCPPKHFPSVLAISQHQLYRKNPETTNYKCHLPVSTIH